MDSNGRELLAILYGLKSFRRLLSGKVVKFFYRQSQCSDHQSQR